MQKLVFSRNRIFVQSQGMSYKMINIEKGKTKKIHRMRANITFTRWSRARLTSPVRHVDNHVPTNNGKTKALHLCAIFSKTGYASLTMSDYQTYSNWRTFYKLIGSPQNCQSKEEGISQSTKETWQLSAMWDHRLTPETQEGCWRANRWNLNKPGAKVLVS